MALEIKNRRIVKEIEEFPGSISAITFKCEALKVRELTSNPKWRISRRVDLGGDRVETLFAGRGLFEHTCDDREDPGLFPPVPFINTISTLFDGGAGEARTVDGAGNLSFERTQAFTFSAWVKRESATVMSIFDKQESPTTFRGYAYVLNGGKPQLVIRNNNTTGNALTILSNTTIALNDWAHIAATYAGDSNANNAKNYINGALTSSTIVDNNLTGTILNNIRFRVGRRDGGAIPFDGNIDQPSIFFKEFTALEIAELFATGKPKAFSEHSQFGTLAGGWDMGDGQLFPAIADQSPNGNNLTILNLGAGAFVEDPAVVV